MEIRSTTLLRLVTNSISKYQPPKIGKKFKKRKFSEFFKILNDHKLKQLMLSSGNSVICPCSDIHRQQL